jgi:serine protease Do
MPLPIPGRVADIVRQSTVVIKTGDRNRPHSSGSGVVLSPEQVITNAHVIHGRTGIQIEPWEGSVLPAKLVRLDRSRDLALISVPGLRSAPLPLSDSQNARAGLPVFAIGNPLGFVGAVSSGVIHSSVGTNQWICADVQLAPGNSGGPLCDFMGQVLGINTMVASGGLAYAVPSRSVQRFLANAPYQQLGVVIRAVEFQPKRFGVLVLALLPNSAAEQASLLPGDILVGANGGAFRNVDDLPAAIEAAQQGMLRLEFYRGNHASLRHVTVDLGSQGKATAA